MQQRASFPAYPSYPEAVPPDIIEHGAYTLYFARTAEEVAASQRLRFEVFNLELDEGLEDSYRAGRDEDAFDPQCHHLIVWERATSRAVGTYRMQTAEMAQAGLGFYSDVEFDLGALPPAIRSHAVEIGRACVARDHRSLQVLYLLWSGLGRYLACNRKRYLFGCSSLTSQNPEEGLHVWAHLQAAGYAHPTLAVHPRPGFRCQSDIASDPEQGRRLIPRLMRVYLSIGARICGPPALDTAFKTIDFLTFFDAETLDQRALTYFRYRSGGPAST